MFSAATRNSCLADNRINIIRGTNTGGQIQSDAAQAGLDYSGRTLWEWLVGGKSSADRKLFCRHIWIAALIAVGTEAASLPRPE